MVPLELLHTGEWADVTEVNGEPVWISRLAELGLRCGCRVQMLQAGSPFLLGINGSRLSLRPERAMQILVRPVG